MDFFIKIAQKLLPDDSDEPKLIGLTFTWGIENFHSIPNNVPQQSTTFMVAQVPYLLELTKDVDMIVKLRQVKPCEPPAKLLCTASLVDWWGKSHHLRRNEVEIGKGSEEKELLKIPSIVVEETRLFSMDTLSIRFSVDLLTDDDSFSPHVSKSSLETLSRDLKKLHEDKTDSDVVLRAGDTEYKAHRLVLAARSPTFAKMLRRNAKEQRKGKIDIEDAEPPILGTLLDYIYTGKVQKLTPDTAAKLIDAADRYQLQELKKTCIGFLAANLALENICSAILAAEMFQDEELENAVLDFVSKRASEIFDSDKWRDFKTKHPVTANSVLGSALLFGKEVGGRNLNWRRTKSK